MMWPPTPVSNKLSATKTSGKRLKVDQQYYAAKYQIEEIDSMSMKTWIHLSCCLALGVSLAFIASLRAPAANAQNVSTGEWTASIEKQGSGINLTFGQTSEMERTGERGSRHQFGQTYE